MNIRKRIPAMKEQLACDETTVRTLTDFQETLITACKCNWIKGKAKAMDMRGHAYRLISIAIQFFCRLHSFSLHTNFNSNTIFFVVFISYSQPVSQASSSPVSGDVSPCKVRSRSIISTAELLPSFACPLSTSLPPHTAHHHWDHAHQR